MELKNPFLSKTIWGAIIMALPVVSSLFGYDLDQTKIAVLNEAYDTITTFVGGALVLWGRFTATTSLGFKG